MKEIKIIYEDTGEVRSPMKGEWFRNTRGFPERAMFDFQAIRLPITKQIVTEEAKDELLES